MQEPNLDEDGNVTFKFSGEIGHTDCILGACLHSAFLHAFYNFGYEYILDPAVEELRQDLAKAASTRKRGRERQAEVASIFKRYAPMGLGRGGFCLFCRQGGGFNSPRPHSFS